MRSPFAQLHAPLFVGVVFGTLVLARGVSLLIPLDFYFTFQALFSDRAPQGQVIALIGKTVAPVLVGLICGVAMTAAARRRWRHSNNTSFARRVSGLYSSTLFAGGFFASFLSAWPAMVYWDLLANPGVAHLKPAFFGLYVLYMLAFGYVTVLGMLLGIFLSERLQGLRGHSESVSLRELTRVGALWLVNSSLASAAMKALTG